MVVLKAVMPVSDDKNLCSRENGKMALRSQSFNERRTAPAPARAPHSDGELADDDEAPANLTVNGKGRYFLYSI